MKTNFLTAITAFAAAFLAVSCDPEAGNAPEPNFPAAETVTVESDSEYNIEIEPNQAWEVSISAAEAGQHFRIKDGDTEVFAVRGEAGKATVTVVVKEADFENHTVNVSMTMNGRTEVIRTLTLPAKEKYLKVYAAVMTEAGDDFVKKDGTFTFSDTELPAGSEMNLIWGVSEAAPVYNNALTVDTSVDWQVSEKPEWLVLSVSEGTAGRTSVTLSCNVEDLSVDGDLTGNMTIKADDKTFTVGVKVASAAGLVRFIGLPEDGVLRFDDSGKYTGDASGNTTFSGQVVSDEELKYYVYTVQTMGDITIDNVADIDNNRYGVVINDTWNEATGTVRLHILTVAIGEMLDGDFREAKIIVLPASAAPATSMEMLDYSTGYPALKEEYKDDIRFSIEQTKAAEEEYSISLTEGLPGDVTSAIQLEELTLEDIEADEDLKNDYYEPVANGAVCYRITYSKEFTEEEVKNGITISGAYRFDSEAEAGYNGISIYPMGESDWVTFEPDRESMTQEQIESLTGPEKATLLMKKPDVAGKTADIRLTDSSWNTKIIIICVPNF